MVEVTPATEEALEVPEVLKKSPQIDQSKAWRMSIDGVKNSLRVGVRVMLKSPEGAIFEHCLRLNFLTTNNEAKYEAFITGLRSTKKVVGSRTSHLQRFKTGGQSGYRKV